MIRQFFFLILFSTTLNSQESIRVITTEYPPFQYKSNDQVVGVSADIVRAILEKADLKYKIEIFPWARAELYFDKEEILFFNLSKTDERLNRYKWIAPITPNNPTAWKLKARNDIKIFKLLDLKNYVIGVLPNSVEEKYLEGRGIPKKQFSEVTLNEQNVGKLALGRIDVLPLDETVFRHICKKLDYNDGMFEKAFNLSDLNSSSYLVASLNVPNKTVKKLQLAWELLNKEKVIEGIRLNHKN